MPVSRKRRRRQPARTGTHRTDRTRQRSGGSPTQVISVSLDELLTQEPSEEDLRHMVRALEAGADGDVAASLEHELSVRVVLETTHRFAMKDLLDLGDAAPAWAFCRWCLDLAYRSTLLFQDPRVEEAVRLALVTLHPAALEHAWDDPQQLKVLGTRVAAGDPVVEDLVLFELGGLRDYLDSAARRGLLDRTDRIGEWLDAPMGSYAFRGLRGCRLVLTDMVTGEEVEALNIGAMSGADEDHLVGRLVPISAEPGLMFAARPIPVDGATAEHVADALRSGVQLAWVIALGDALDHGHQHEQFHCIATTPFTSDLPFLSSDALDRLDDDSPRVAELRAKGYSALVASVLGVLEVARTAVTSGDHGAAVVAPHVTAALATPGAFEAAKAECATSEWAPVWEVLAAVVPEHVAELCRELASCARTTPG